MHLEKRKNSTELLHRSLRPLSAVRLCAQRAAGGAALREQRERKPSEKSREIAADRVNFPACGALNWLACGAFRSACGAFRSACGAKRTRPKSQACGGSLLTCLLTRRGSGLRANKWQQANAPVVVQQHASLLFRSLLIHAGCNSYGPVFLCLKQKIAAPFAWKQAF